VTDTPDDTPETPAGPRRKSHGETFSGATLYYVHRSAVQTRKVLPTSPFRRLDTAPPTTDGFHVGGRVTHDRFGMGKIVAVDPEFVTVDFGDGSVKQLRAGARGLDRL